jgi:hypothetical protein
MAFQVLYPDSDHIYDLSATPTTKSTLNSAGLAVQVGSSATQAVVNFDLISVADATAGTTMNPGSLTCSGPANLKTVITDGEIAFGPVSGSLPLDSVSIASADGLKITSGPFQPDELLDVSGNAGDAGQYLLSGGAGAAPVWTTVSAPATPNLAAVLAVATAGDAEDQPISNLTSAAFQPSAVGQTALVLSKTASTSASPVAAEYDVLTSSQSYDGTTGRAFQNKYMEVVLDGVHYWVPLFI